MPKNPKAHNAVGYRGPAGHVYADTDRRLDGMGNPPSCPQWQAANPGSGRFVMHREVVGVDELDEERRPPEEKWLLKPAADRVGHAINIAEPEPEPT